MSFRRRIFPEILESLLTSMTGGVAAETQPFPPAGATTPPFANELQQPPVADVVSVWGTLGGDAHLFRKNVDYSLSDDKRSLLWAAQGAEYPDAGTLFTVNYRPAAAQSELTDVQVGSVLRTLTETTALELARLYAVLESVYQSAFVDTATNSSLDNVVALLGIQRVRGGRPSGEVEFVRAANTLGEITIPGGMRVATADGRVEYETTETVTMRPAQSSIRVVARDLESNDPLPAGALTLLPVPVAGIASVTNPAPTAIVGRDESDDELRTRAKNVLHGSERATLGAIQQAVHGAGITADIDEGSTPGVVRITPHAESMPPDLQQRLLSSLNEVRPAGVVLELGAAAAPRKVNLELRLESASGLLAQDLRAAQRSVRDEVTQFFEQLPVREPASINQLVGRVLGVPGVQDVTIVAATVTSNGGPPSSVLDAAGGKLDIEGFPTVLGDLHIADPDLPTLIDVTVSHPAAQTPPDETAIRAALANAIAAVNAANEGGGAGSVSFAQLLAATPLPGVAVGADPLPYVVKYVFTLESGLSQILGATGDVYVLVPAERLALSGVHVEAVNGG
jgi:hypothetical protein